MKVSDVLKSNQQTLATCIPEESITSVCTRLSTLNIGAFPVCDAHGALIATSCALSPRTARGWRSGAFAT